MIRVHKGKDFLERVGWTAIEFFAGAIVSTMQTGDPLTWYTFLYAVATAALKVAAAQHVGARGSGDAIPGGVEKIT